MTHVITVKGRKPDLLGEALSAIGAGTPEPPPMTRLVTPCCGAPLLERPFQCMHEFEAWRADGRDWPSCWIGHRPRQAQLLLPLEVAA